MLAHQGGDDLDVGRGVAEAGGDGLGRSAPRSPSGRGRRGTLPMSCSSAASSSRSARPTQRTSPPAMTTVSMRCRSTVWRCTALRCGRERTAAHSGSQRSMMPAWSRPSQTPTSPGPVASRSAKQVAGDLGPRLGERCGACAGEVGQRGRARSAGCARAATTAARSGQQRVAGQGRAGAEDDLAVVLEHAEAQRVQLRAAWTDPQGAGALRLAGPAHRAVERVGDGPRRRRPPSVSSSSASCARAARRRRRGPPG